MKTPALTESITTNASHAAETVTDALGDAWQTGSERLSDLAGLAAGRAGDVGHRVAERLPDPDAIRTTGRRAARTARQQRHQLRRHLPGRASGGRSRRTVPTIAVVAMIVALAGAALWWRGRRHATGPTPVAGWPTAVPDASEDTTGATTARVGA